MIGLLVGAPKGCNEYGSSAKICFSFIVCFSVISHVPFSKGQTREQVELRREILSHYNKSVAPSFKIFPAEVGFVYYPSRIRQFDESAGTLIVEGQLLLNWMDERLRWNRDPNYGKIRLFNALPNDIWIPKINVFNSGRAEQYANTKNPVYCTKMGRILWKISAELHPVCTVADLRWYPTDTHTCTLSLGALYPKEIEELYFGGHPKMVDNGIRRSNERKSPQWDMLNLEHQESYSSFGNKAIFYPTSDFIFTIRRQGWPLLAAFLPLTMCFIFLSWSSFALPLHGTQLTKRLSVATSSLFLSSALLLVLIKTFPGAGQKPPIIVKVNVCVVVMTFLTCLHTIVVSRVHRNSTTFLKGLLKLPSRLQCLLGLKKVWTQATTGGEDNLLANTEFHPDSGQNHLQEEPSLDDESDTVVNAYDRAHLILQIIILTLAITFFCLV